MSNNLKQLGLIIALSFLFMPAFAAAQTSDTELRTTIQNSLLADPRTASIPPQLLSALVDSLTAQAQAQHMTASDILWKPQSAAIGSTYGTPGNSASATNCPTGWQGYACQFNEMFGFDGSNYEVPIFILIITIFLIAIIWEMIAHHRKKMLRAGRR